MIQTIELDEEMKEATSNHLIVCDGLVKIYKSSEVEVMALQGLDMEVKEGELMAIIGKSGSGKSTLMNMLGGLEKPTAGRLYVDGLDLFAMDEKALVKYRRDKVGFVWQKSSRNLFDYLDALNNVMAVMVSGSKADKEKRAKELLVRVGLERKMHSFPRQMSGGEQQRVAIAVALANNPRLLLADEPTGAVDVKTSNQIQDLFRDLNEQLGLTIIIVTHDLSLANKVNRVVMISDGKIGTEKILKQSYKERIKEIDSESLETDLSHEEYAIMDRSRRVQLDKEMLSQAGIDSNKVKIHMDGDKIIIESAKDDEA